MSFGKMLALLILAMTSTIAVAAQQTKPAAAVVEQPRPFGYTLGDVITQRVLLTTPGADIEPAPLQAAQRVNIWFERRSTRIEKSPDQRRWLVVEYQLINAPSSLATVQLPAWELTPQSGSTPLRIPAVPITVAPLVEKTSTDLMPDREVPIISTTPARTNSILWSIALVAVLVAWFFWARWRDWRESFNQPFARAQRELRRVDEMAPEAWQALHRAFDHTAGRVLQLQTLPALFERAPHFGPQRAAIESFFAQSNERFFGAGLRGETVSVRALCNELRRIERRHAR